MEEGEERKGRKGKRERESRAGGGKRSEVKDTDRGACTHCYRHSHSTWD